MRGDGLGTGSWDRGRSGGPTEGNKYASGRECLLPASYVSTGLSIPNLWLSMSASLPLSLVRHGRKKVLDFTHYSTGSQSTQPRCDDLPSSQSLNGYERLREEELN